MKKYLIKKRYWVLAKQWESGISVMTPFSSRPYFSVTEAQLWTEASKMGHSPAPPSPPSQRLLSPRMGRATSTLSAIGFMLKKLYCRWVMQRLLPTLTPGPEAVALPRAWQQRTKHPQPSQTVGEVQAPRWERLPTTTRGQSPCQPPTCKAGVWSEKEFRKE